MLGLPAFFLLFITVFRKKGGGIKKRGNEVLQCITNLQTPEDKGFQEVADHKLTAIKYNF